MSKYILAAGGTGGHMVPAHALAAELKARGHGVALVTDDRGAKIPALFEDVPVHVLPAGRMGGGPIDGPCSTSPLPVRWPASSWRFPSRGTAPCRRKWSCPVPK